VVEVPAVEEAEAVEEAGRVSGRTYAVGWIMRSKEQG